MLKSKFNFAWVFALIALIAYTYIGFMGLIYSQILPMGLSALAAFVFIAIIIILLRTMCKAKATRWLRLGLLGQIIIGLFILALLLFSSIFFTHFTKMIDEQEQIVRTYSQTIDDARKLDEKYREYVEERSLNYRSQIRALTPGTQNYNKMIAKPAQLGFNRNQIADKYQETMKRFLLGADIDELNTKRAEWLAEDSTTVWNVNLPKNIQDVTSSVNKWLYNYQELSSKQFTLEKEYPCFEDTEFNTNAQKLQEICMTITKPSILAILLALLCFVLIMLPWIITTKDIASVGDENNYIVEMPEE